MSKVDNFRANLNKLVEKPHGRKKEVALAAGITPQYLSSILTGIREPGLDIAVRLCDALGQSFDAMLMLPSDFAQINTRPIAAGKSNHSIRQPRPRLQRK